MIDVGCGLATWLRVFREHGINDVVGVDGPWIELKSLEISEQNFITADLREPFQLDRTFDLVISLEVAEHLPRESAETLVDSLARLGPIVLFSAAIPHQGGTLHVNEQWPEWWADLFRRKGYEPIDCIRHKIWQNDRVAWPYAQNTFLYVRGDVPRGSAKLRRELNGIQRLPLPLVHPAKYLQILKWLDRLQTVVRTIGSLIEAHERFILVDEEELGCLATAGRRAIPFLERDGKYWGPPPDDAIAISELTRLMEGGATYIVFAWPARWWLDYYSGFERYLRSHFKCVVENDCLVIFDLRTPTSETSS